MARPSSYTSPEILAWSKEEVAEKLVSDIVFTSKYCEAFIDNEIDGRELLDLKAEDLTELGVTTLKHKKDVLRWIEANIVKSSMCEVEVAPTHTDLPIQRCMPTQVSYPSQTMRIESSFQRLKSDPGPSYERIFKPPKARQLTDDTSHLWGKKYLLEYNYHHQHKLLKNNEGIVKSWFLNRSQPLIDSFFTGSFRHNPELQKALKDFIQARESELSSLVFDGGSSIIRWKVDDIYLFFLEQKHYKTGKGAVLDAKKKGGISTTMDVPNAPCLSSQDLKVLELCSSTHSFHMIGLKNQTSTTKLAMRDHVIVNCSSTLPDDISGTHTRDIGLLETANRWGVQTAVVFGTGTPLTLLRNKPYIAWSVQIDTLSEIDDACSSWFIPCGQQFPYHNATIGSLSVGQVIEIPISYVTTQERDVQLKSPTVEVDRPISDDMEHIEQLEIFLDIPRVESSKKKECNEVNMVKSSKRLQLKKLKASAKSGDDKSAPTASQLKADSNFTLEAKEVVAMFTMDAACVDDVYAQLQTFMKDKNVVHKKDRKGVVPFQKYTGLTKLEQLDMVVEYALKHVVKLVDLPRLRDDGLQDVFSENIEFI